MGNPNLGQNQLKRTMVHLCANKKYGINIMMAYLCNPQAVLLNVRSLSSLPSCAALACLNRTPMAACLELSLTVLFVCHGKPPKARLAPPKLPEPEVHLMYIASFHD